MIMVQYDHMTEQTSYYRKLSHTTYDCRYHIVFTPKYRYHVLGDEKVKAFVQKVFEQICDWKEIILIEGNIRPDHVHLYLSVPPKYSISDVAQWLKGKSASRAFQQFPDLLKRYWGGHFWSRGYFVSTIGITDTVIKQYIQNQEQVEQEKENLTKQLRLWK